MPNHVITIITTPNEADNDALAALGRHLTEEERLEETLQRESLLESLKERKSEYVPEPLDLDRWIVDFALLIPEPERMFKGGCDMNHPHPHPDGGFYDACWYDWNRQNWGTKWNAYDVERTEGSVRFETAWNHPFPVIEALSEKFPEVTFDVRYADEDLGANLGHYQILGSKGVRDFGLDDLDPEARAKWAAELWGYDWDEMQAERAEDERREAEFAAAEAVETAVVKGEVL